MLYLYSYENNYHLSYLKHIFNLINNWLIMVICIVVVDLVMGVGFERNAVHACHLTTNTARTVWNKLERICQVGHHHQSTWLHDSILAANEVPTNERGESAVRSIK